MRKNNGKRSNIVYLHILTFGGMVPGASHWFGDLWDGEKHLDVEYTLDATSAKEFNKAERLGGYRYSVGDTSRKFLDRERLIEEAKKQWKTRFPDSVILILGNSAAVSPQKVLDGPKALVTKMNKVYEAFEKGCSDGPETKVEKKCNRQWRKFLYELTGIDYR